MKDYETFSSRTIFEGEVKGNSQSFDHRNLYETFDYMQLRNGQRANSCKHLIYRYRTQSNPMGFDYVPG